MVLNILRICDDFFLCFHHMWHQMDASSFWMSDEPTTCWAWLTVQNNPSVSYTLFHYLKWAALAPPTFSWLAAPHQQEAVLVRAGQNILPDAALTHFSVTSDIFCFFSSQIFLTDTLFFFMLFYCILSYSDFFSVGPQVVRLQFSTGGVCCTRWAAGMHF